MRVYNGMNQIPEVTSAEMQHIMSGGMMLFLQSEFGIRSGKSPYRSNLLIMSEEEDDNCILVCCVGEYSINDFLATGSDEEGTVIGVKLSSTYSSKPVGENLKSAALQEQIGVLQRRIDRRKKLNKSIP